MTIEEIKDLIITLDIKIEAEHGKASIHGLNLLFGITEEKRKQQVLEALNTLSQIEEKLKESKNDWFRRNG